MHGYRSSIFFDRVSFSGNFSREQTFVQLLLILGGIFQNCWWETSTKFVKTAIYASQEKFPMKKYVDSDNLIFSQLFSFFGWNVVGLLEEKTWEGCQNYILNIGRKVFSKFFFVRKFKIFKILRNSGEKLWGFWKKSFGERLQNCNLQVRKNFFEELVLR